MDRIILSLSILFLTTIQLSAQKVGIGTTTPAADLHIVDSNTLVTELLISGTSSGGLMMEHVKGSDQVNLYSQSGLLQFGVGPHAGSLNPRVRIHNGGVGIGNLSSPSHLLHVKGTDPLRLDGLVARISSIDSLLVVDGTGVVKYAPPSSIFGSSGTGFWSRNATNNLYYLDSVGIGTDKPIYDFDLYNLSKSTTFGIGSADEYARQQFSVSGFLAAIDLYGATTEKILSDSISREGLATFMTQKSLPLLRTAGPIYEKSGMIIGNEAAVPLILATNNTEQMRVDSTGNVGIGTNFPQKLLDVDGVTRVQDSLLINTDDTGVTVFAGSTEVFSNTSSIRLKPAKDRSVLIYGSNSPFFWSTFNGRDKRLGVNSIAPKKTLDVGGSQLLQDTLFIKDENVRINRSGNNLELKSFANMHLRPNTTSDVKIFAGSTEWSRFDGGDKRLGIDELNPAKTLDVGGSALVQDTVFFTSEDDRILANTAGIQVRSTKNISLRMGSTDGVTYSGSIPFARFDAGSTSLSIGTTVQDKTLHVNGSTMIQDSIFIDDDNTSIHKRGDDLQSNAIGDIILNAGNNKSISIREDDSQWAYFDGQKGRFGLGTATPDKTIHAEGSAMITDTAFVGGDETYITKTSQNIVVKSENANVDLRAGGVSKKVWIGTDTGTWSEFDGINKRLGVNTLSPTKTLDVNGNGIVNDTLFMHNDNNYISYSPGFDGVVVQSDNDIELRADGNDRVEIHNGTGRYAYFDGSAEQLNLSSPSGSPPLFVNGKAEMKELQVTNGAVPGYVLTSDGSGNATWGPTPPDNDWIVFGGGSHMASGVPGNVTIGGGTALVPSSKLTVAGSMTLPIRTINSSIYPYAPTFNDHTIICLDPAAPINLPAASAAAGRIYIIKFNGGGMLIPGLASDLIEGVPAPYNVAPTGGAVTSVTIQSDGVSGWWILSY